MKSKKKILQYLTQEKQFDGFQAWIEEVENVALEWFTYEVEHRYDETDNSNTKANRNETYHISVSGSPIYIATFAGNQKAVDYLLHAKLCRMHAVKPKEENSFDHVFESGISFHIKSETEDTFSDWMIFFRAPEEIAFTLPLGRLECFKQFLRAGIHCDFHKRENLMLLAMCQEHSFWEYLISHKYLDRAILIIAAGYAIYFKNKETAHWLLERYCLRDEWKLTGGKSNGAKAGKATS